MADTIRLQKYLAEAGVASRRASEKLISEGKVKVNGEVITALGTKIDPETDTVLVNDQPINTEEKVYVLLNKPKGYVCTSKDRHAENIVFDLVDVGSRLHTVGRLDKDTEGLILLTNDGELTQILTHPSHQVDKTYIAVVKGKITEDEVSSLEKGVVIELDDGKRRLTAPAKVKVLARSNRTSTLEITIHEGHKRQVRKMCQAVDHPVIDLKRIKEGILTLEGLKTGQWRFLKPEEISDLKNA